MTAGICGFGAVAFSVLLFFSLTSCNDRSHQLRLPAGDYTSVEGKHLYPLTEGFTGLVDSRHW